jgi:Pentapeptide repeats (8 copies)
MSFSDVWEWYQHHRDDLTPLLTLFSSLALGVGTISVGGLVARAALHQARIARLRHEEQTKADLQRRIAESFSKAVEQLLSEKIEVRLGGVYSLGRISRESPEDYWTVMEVLTAFVRERARLQAREVGSEPPAEVAAVLAVIVRRPQKDRAREMNEGWRFDLSRTDLRGANLEKAHLEGADLFDTHFEGANLQDAHFEGADLRFARFSGNLGGVHFEDAKLFQAHLEGAFLRRAHLQRADLSMAHLGLASYQGPGRFAEANFEGTDLSSADLKGVNLSEIRGTPINLATASADSWPLLPNRIPRPNWWPPPAVSVIDFP